MKVLLPPKNRWLHEIRLSDVVTTLEWNTSFPAGFKLFGNYIRTVESSFHARAETGNHSHAWRCLLMQYLDLPIVNKIRVLSAPVSYGLVAKWSTVEAQDRLTKLEEIISGEQAHLGWSNISMTHCWTGLGDYRFETASRGEQRLLCTYVAPRSTLGIPIDWSSPWSAFSAGDNGGQTTILTDQLGRQEAFDKVDAACRIIKMQGEYIKEFVPTFSRVFCVRCDDSRPQSFGSSSWSREIGKTGLTNINTSLASPERIASAIIHEAIHSMLYMVETIRPIYAKSPHDIRILSPWTGRRLPISSLTHACFVWYGLFCFWAKAQDGPSLTEREKALLGFERGYNEAYSALKKFLTADARTVLSDLPLRVKAIKPLSVKNPSKLKLNANDPRMSS